MIRFTMVRSLLALAACVTLAALLSPLAHAQDARPGRAQPAGQAIQIGIFGDGVLNAPSASFRTLPGVFTCQGDTTLYESGSGGGVVAGVTAAITPAMDAGFLTHIGYGLNIGFSSASTSFETEERIGQAIDRAGNIVPVMSRYTIDATITELRIEPSATYQVSAETPLHLGLGLNLGFLMGATFDQGEHIASPSSAEFTDGSAVRNELTGDIQETSGFQAGLAAVIAYDIPLSPSFTLRPQVNGMLRFTSPVTDVTWSPHELRGGIALLYTLPSLLSNPLDPNDDKR